MTRPLDAAALAALTAGPRKQTEYLHLARRLREAGGLPGARSLRVAFLGSATFDFLEPYLVVEGARAGWSLTPRFAGFGQLEQVLLQPGAAVFDPPPDLLVLFVRPEDADPWLTARPFGGDSDALPDSLVATVDRLAGCLELFRQRSRAPILVANFAPTAQQPLGLFEANTAGSLTYRRAEANGRIRAAVARTADAYVWDYAALVTAQGAATWSDPRLAMLARTPVAAANQPALARHLVATINGILRRPGKCLVLDLDNTIWGGVLGDDGLQGVLLGDDYPGNVFKAFQRTVRGLADRGILLAVASKNDEPVVRRAFAEHPEMVLRQEDIAVFQCHWGPKSQSMRAIADALNIGIDALVFFDDNPVERAEVRTNTPEVQVVEVPSEPLEYGAALLASGLFEQASLSEEDRQRTRLYRQEQARTRHAEQFPDMDQFLTSLAMVATVGRADEGTVARVSQLVAKTNQFNLTTRRHSQADIVAMMDDPTQAVLWLRLRDRFGDQGLVGVMIVTVEGPIATIDTFLMSCRVMGRRVEEAMLAYVAEEARRLGATTLVGVFRRTPKNTPVREFYPGHGFTPADAGDDPAQSRYRSSLDAPPLAWPAVIGRAEAGHPADEAIR